MNQKKAIELTNKKGKHSASLSDADIIRMDVERKQSQEVFRAISSNVEPVSFTKMKENIEAVEREFEKIEASRRKSQKDWKEIQKLKKETKKLISEMQS